MQGLYFGPGPVTIGDYIRSVACDCFSKIGACFFLLLVPLTREFVKVLTKRVSLLDQGLIGILFESLFYFIYSLVLRFLTPVVVIIFIGS